MYFVLEVNGKAWDRGVHVCMALMPETLGCRTQCSKFLYITVIESYYFLWVKKT